MANERDLAYQTSADELIIRIIRGTYDMRIGRRNAILFPRLHIFLFDDEKGAAKASRNKIINLWQNNVFWDEKGRYKNGEYFFKTRGVNIDIKKNIKNLVLLSRNVLRRGANSFENELTNKIEYGFNFDKIVNAKPPKDSEKIMSKSVFNYSITNSYWGVHKVYIEKNTIKKLIKYNKKIGQESHRIQMELIYSINNNISKYISEKEKTKILEDDNDDQPEYSYELQKLISQENDFSIMRAATVPKNIDTEVAKIAGGLPAQQIVSSSPGTKQNICHEAFKKEEEATIKWSEQKKDNGFRCTFCWRLNCREKGDNPTKAHSQRFDRPDTATYAYWICKRLNYKKNQQYKDILKLIHRPIGILKLAGQCHPVYDSLGYPVKIFYSPGFFEWEMPALKWDEIPDRSFMWLNYINNEGVTGSWLKYVDALALVQGHKKNWKSAQKKSANKNSFPNNSRRSIVDILFGESRDKVIVPFQDYAFTKKTKIFDEIKKIRKNNPDSNQISNMVRVLGMYIKWEENKGTDQVKYFCEGKRIDFEKLKDYIDFAMYDRALFLNLLFNGQQSEMVENVQTIYNKLHDDLTDFTGNVNKVYSESSDTQVKMSTPSDLKMFTSNFVGAVTATENNVSHIYKENEEYKELRGESNSDVLHLADKAHFNGWPEPFNRIIVTCDYNTYQMAIESDLYNDDIHSTNISVDFAKRYNLFNSYMQNEFLDNYTKTENSKSNLYLNRYHRSRHCDDISDGLKKFAKILTTKGILNNINDINGIFHNLMFLGLEYFRRYNLSNLNDSDLNIDFTGKGKYFPVEPWDTNRGGGSNGAVISNNIDTVIKKYIELYQKWKYENIRVYIPHEGGATEFYSPTLLLNLGERLHLQKRSKNKRGATDGTPNLNIYSQIDINNNNISKMWPYTLILYLNYTDELDNRETSILFDDVPNLSSLIQHDNIETLKKWTIKTVISDYFNYFMTNEAETLLKKQPYHDDINISELKQSWAYFYKSLVHYALRPFTLGQLYNKYEKKRKDVLTKWKQENKQTGKRKSLPTNFEKQLDIKLRF